MPAYVLSFPQLARARSAIRVLACAALFLLAATVARAQVLLGSPLTVGAGAGAVAVNPVTGMVYVANNSDGTVSVIDGSHLGIPVSTVKVGLNPVAIAVDPGLNQIYTANFGDNPPTVSVFNGAQLPAPGVAAAQVQLSSFGAIQDAQAIVVDPVTHQVYVANYHDSGVSVFDGSQALTAFDTINPALTVTVLRLPANSFPFALAVDPVTNLVYATNQFTGTLSVLNGATATQAASVSSTFPVGSSGGEPRALAVNPVTNQLFVVNEGDGDVGWVDGSSLNVTAISLVSSTSTAPNSDPVPIAIAVNPASNQIYVASLDASAASAGTLAVLDGTNLGGAPTSLALGAGPSAVAVNSVTNQVYAASEGDDQVSVFDGTNLTASPTAFTLAAGPRAIAVDPVRNRAYSVNADNTVSVINGAKNAVTPVALPTGAPQAVAVDPVSNTIWVTQAGAGNGTVSLVAGANLPLGPTTLAVTANPSAVAVDPVLGQAYVANNAVDSNGHYTVSAFSGAGSLNGTVIVGANPVALAVNPVTGQVFAVNSGDGTVSAFTGNSLGAIPLTLKVGANPVAAAVDPVTSLVYVANSGDGTVSVLDGANLNDSSTRKVTVGAGPGAIALNPATHQIYVANGNAGTVSVLNGFALPGPGVAAPTVTVGNQPVALVVNPVSNQIFVANSGDGTVSVIDGTSLTVATLAVGASPSALAVNPITNQVYVASSTGTVVPVIDGATLSVPGAVPSISMNGQNPLALAVNPVTNRVYVATSGPGGTTLAVIDVDGALAVPISIAVTAVDGLATAGGQPIVTTDPNAVLAGTVACQFPFVNTNPPPTALYYRVDDGASANWSPAALDASGATFSVTLNQESLGLHTLYLWAAYGNEGGAASSGFGTGNSPEISNLLAFPLAVQPVPSSTAVTADVNPQALGQPVNLTATVTPASGPAPTGSVSFYDGTQLLQTVVLNGGSNTATWLAPSLADGPHAITANYAGDATYGFSSGTLAVTIYGTPASISILQGNNQTPALPAGSPLAGVLVFQVLDANGFPVPNQNVTFSGNGLAFAPFNAGASSAASGPGSGSGRISGGAINFAPSISQASDATGSVEVAAASTLAGTLTGTASLTLAGGGVLTFTFTESALAGTPASITPVSGGGQVATAGTAFANPLVAQVLDGNAIPVPGVTVAFTGAGLLFSTDGIDFAASVNPSTDATGSAQVMATPTATGGLTVTAQVAGSNPVLSASFPETGASPPPPPPTVPVQPGLSLVSSPNPSQPGNPVTFTATVTATVSTRNIGPAGLAPTGSVSFLDGTASLGNGSVVAGIATLTTSALAAGSHQVTAQYSGDSTFSALTSQPLTQSVLYATTVTVTSSGPSDFGQPVTFTAMVTAPSGTPTGSVRFTQGTALLGTATLSGGTATLQVAGLAEGTDTVSASYSGDADDAPSVSAGLDQGVSSPVVVITAPSATALSLQPGGSASLQFTVSSKGTLGGPVGFTVSGLPAGVTCTFSSSSVDVSGGPVTDTLTFSASAATASLGLGRGAGALLVCGLFALPLARGRRRAGRALCGLGLLLLAGLAGCVRDKISVSGNPPVTSTVTITASSPGATPAVTTLQLTVQ